ncbi:MAG TPA: hypothetical protein VFV78_08780 [Vicinamibacterales bacterium]|nr:hypothetical protein [Vicinamibacterales bacterium]
MNDWQVIFLGVMAGALVLMALAQAAVAIALARSVKHVVNAIDDLKREVNPLIHKANRIAEDAGRVSALAVVQAERIDVLIQQTTARVDETFGVLQTAVVEPIRQGTAILSAIRAGVAAIRAWQGRAAAPQDDEDPLFVG